MDGPWKPQQQQQPPPQQQPLQPQQQGNAQKPVTVQLLSEIPSSLKTLARLVVRGFYGVEDALLVDMLVRYPCLREDDIANLLKLDKKFLRARMTILRNDKFVQTKLRMETDEEGKVAKVNCYFINYRTFVNVVKYKLDHMRKKMETSDRDQTSRASFKCLGCGKNFTDLEANRLLDFRTGEMRCTFCSGTVDEDESAGPMKDSRLLLAKFNQEMKRLYELLHMTETMQLAGHLLEPEPVDIDALLGKKTNKAAGGAGHGDEGGAGGGGKWSGEGSRTSGFRMDSQHVEVAFDGADGNEEGSGGHKAGKVKNPVPIWISQPAIHGDDDGLGNNGFDRVDGGVDKGSNDDDVRHSMSNSMMTEDNEISSLLLRHEAKGTNSNHRKLFIPGADSDQSEQSDDSDSGERSTTLVDDDLSFFKNGGGKDGGVGAAFSNEDGQQRVISETVKVAGKDLPIEDIQQQIIDRMTSAEKDRFIAISQEIYSRMFE